ncbi:hypothetical protein EB18_00210 [Enterococcus cecorum]|uniref:Uncharacterized protein n=1 Tax=Enterococcus cecorum TaxID=44008 RepID=A0A366SJV8_9ENTE|nr:hypothetical protein EB18_00210 [Enterococcus cecorum]
MVTLYLTHVTPSHIKRILTSFIIGKFEKI